MKSKMSRKSKSTHIHVVHLCSDLCHCASLKLDQPAKNRARAIVLYDALQIKIWGASREPKMAQFKCILFIATWWGGDDSWDAHPRGPGVVPAVVLWCNFGAQALILTTNNLSASSWEFSDFRYFFEGYCSRQQCFKTPLVSIPRSSMTWVQL